MYFESSAHIDIREIQKKFTYEDTVVLDVDIAYPEITLRDSPIVQNRINRHYRQQADRFFIYASKRLYADAVQFYIDAQKNGFPFHAFDAVMEYEVTRNEGCRLSAYYDRYTYTGGAHGATIRASDSWDLRTGRRIALSSLFARGSRYRRLIIEQIQAQADKNMAENPNIYFEDYRTLIIEHFNPESYFMTPEGLGFYYQQYEIAPYSSGIIVFEIPYGDLGIEKPGCLNKPVR